MLHLSTHLQHRMHFNPGCISALDAFQSRMHFSPGCISAHDVCISAQRQFSGLLSNTEYACGQLNSTQIMCCGKSKNKSTVFWSVIPTLYSFDLRWRIIWIALTWHASPQDIGQQLSVSEQTVRRHLKMFEKTSDVKPRSCKSGLLRLFGEHEQLALLRLILENPGIFQHEI